MRDHARRLGKLEVATGQDRPRVVFASCPIPAKDQPVTDKVIDGWLRDGLAHHGYGQRHVIVYRGVRGVDYDLTPKQWEKRVKTEMRDSHAKQAAGRDIPSQAR